MVGRHIGGQSVEGSWQCLATFVMMLLHWWLDAIKVRHSLRPACSARLMVASSSELSGLMGSGSSAAPGQMDWNRVGFYLRALHGCVCLDGCG